MSDQIPILLLTRPEPQSRLFLAECEEALGRPIPAVVSPILRIDPVENEIDLARYNTLIVTSANAVRLLDRRLTGMRVATVGEQTAEIARSLGADADCLGENVEAFLANSGLISAPAVHLRGRHSRGSLAHRLCEIGIPTDECILYDQTEQPLSEDAVAALASGHACLPIFSPRSAALMSAYSAHPDTVVLAISQAAADAWKGEGSVKIAHKPDRASMTELAVGCILGARLVAPTSDEYTEGD